MPDDVGALKLDHRYSAYSSKFFHRVNQPALDVVGQIDLGGVAGDDQPGVMAQPGQKHQHLRSGRVLGFVEDDSTIVEGAPTHESQGNHFDDVVDHESLDLIEVHHVVQGVKKRAKVGVYLGLEVARKKSETFARFDRGACKNYALDLAMLEQGGGGGDG